MKICNKCKIEKNINGFYKDITKQDKLHSLCKECQNKNNKKYFKRNKEQINSWRKKRYEINNEKILERNRNYRAKKNNAEGSFTEKEFQEKLELYNYKYCGCGVDLRKTIIHRDHVLPLSKGGTDYIENIQPLCEHCNCSKNTKHIDFRDNWLQNYAI